MKHIFFSGDGGTRYCTPEVVLDKPCVMFSHYSVTDDNRVDKRFRALVESREYQSTLNSKQMKVFFSGNSTGPSLPERALADADGGKGANIMLTHYELANKDNKATGRFKALKDQRRGKVICNGPPERVWMHFLDSGAFSLFFNNVLKNKECSQSRSRSKRYRYYYTDEFWQYVDQYAEFVKKHKIACDYYANLDVIFHAKLTRKVQRYLERQHGLEPVPAVHCGTDVAEFQRYMAEGYDYIALGGLGMLKTGTRDESLHWLDTIFKAACKGGSKPRVRIHGFAMTGFDVMVRYPWWSVDSASWTKAAGYGTVLVPHKRHGEWTFSVKPYSLQMSDEVSQGTGKKSTLRGTNRHLLNLPPNIRKIVEEWLEFLGLPVGCVDRWGECKKWGVTSHFGARKIANLRYYKFLEESLPEWPWAFKSNRERASFNLTV